MLINRSSNLMFIRVFLLFILIFSEAIIFAQKPLRLSFNHLTREDGLSNNNNFSLYCDSRGLLWLGGHNGLNKFDGLTIKVYKPSNSRISGNHIKNIVEDKQTNLWIGTENGLSKYNREKDQFENVLFPNNQKHMTFPFAIDRKGHVWLQMSHNIYRYEPSANRFHLIVNHVSDNITSFAFGSDSTIKTIYCSFPNSTGLQIIHLKQNRVTNTESHFTGKNNEPLFQNLQDYIFAENDSTIWITGGSLSLIKFNPIRKTVRNYNQFGAYPANYLAGIAFYKNYLLVGSQQGLYVFDKNKEKFVQLVSKLPTDIHSIMTNWVEKPYVDKDGNLFLSQLGSGISFTNFHRQIAENWLSLDEVKSINMNDNSVSNIVKNGENVIIKFQSGGAYVLNSKGHIIKKLGSVAPIYTDSKSRTWLSNSKGFLLLNKELKISKTLIFESLADKMGYNISVTEIADGHYLLGTAIGLFEYFEKSHSLKKMDFPELKQNSNFSPLYFDKENNQLFVSANWWSNFYVLSLNNDVWKFRKKVNLQTQTFCIRTDNGIENIWLGTAAGLIKMNRKNLDYQIFTERDGLPDNVVTDFLTEKNGNYWLVTNLGIAYYTKKNNQFQQFTSKDGAYAKEYDWNSVFKLSDGRVVFGGTSGVTLISPENNISYPIQPKIHFSKFSINEKDSHLSININEAKSVKLKPKENTFAIHTVGIEYGFPAKVKLKYRLKGYNNQWIHTENPAVARFANVGDGNYVFEVMAANENGQFGEVVKKLNISVPSPFYRTTWFRILLFLTFLLLVFLIYRLRISQIREGFRKKEEIRRIKAEAEINALRSQMNPHFIFNCLNTIDAYILTNKTHEASDFLNKFSKLIRIILENSRQEFVPIDQDLQALELYIKLEQERSFPKFDFEISLDPNILNSTFFIPSLLLQPFVENAILHGLKHKTDGTGRLDLALVKKEDAILIQIKDNGIGRTNAKKINDTRNYAKSSVGIKLTEERINKLNEIYADSCSIQISDLNEHDQTGTKIEITLPLITHENLVK